MDLKQLRYFIAVVEELDFSRAAARLHMTQPPLSRQIRDLEDSLGVQLLLRNKRGVELTEAGSRFLNEARALLEQAKRAVSVTQRTACGEIGTLEIGYANTIPYTGTLSNLVGAYRQAFPKVEMTLTEMTSHQQIDKIIEGKLDIGFVRLPIQGYPGPVSFTTLLSESFLVALPDTHPLSELPKIPLKLLAEQPFIFYSRELRTGVYEQFITMCKEAGFEPRITQEAKQAAAIISLVAAGLGISLMPTSLKCLTIRGAVYRPLETANATRVALAHRSTGCDATARKFIDLSLATTQASSPVRNQSPFAR